MPKQPFNHLEPVMTFQEIADLLGITRQGACDLYMKGMKKLKARHQGSAGRMLAELEQTRHYAKAKGARSPERA